MTIQIKFNRLSIPEKDLEIKKQKQELKDSESFMVAFEIELANYDTYTRKTSTRLNEMSQELLNALFKSPCWAHYTIRSSKKRDLIEAMKLIVLRTRENNEKRNAWVLEKESEIKESIAYLKKLEKGYALMQRVYDHPDFDDMREGFDQRQWDCMVDLIETGYVIESELHEYGIDLD